MQSRAHRYIRRRNRNGEQMQKRQENREGKQQLHNDVYVIKRCIFPQIVAPSFHMLSPFSPYAAFAQALGDKIGARSEDKTDPIFE